MALARVRSGERAEDALQAEAPPPGRDRALAWHLASGTLQHQRELDWVIAASSKRPLESLDPTVHLLLRVALYELRHGKAPARAVVHQAVELCRALRLGRAAGFVNAVLRNQGRVGEPPPRALLNHPDWLLDRWEARLGKERCERWARRNNQPAPLTLALNGAQPELEAALREAGLEAREARAAGENVPGLLTLEGPTGPVTELPGAALGSWWVQDPAAAAVSDLLGCGPGWRVLDACAAPGGKTFRMLTQGATVVAADRSERRLATLRKGLERLRLQARTRVHDWLEGPMDDLAAMDGVLVDAPCSGLGTTRRHPEIRWRRQPRDLVRNPEQQLAVLVSAAHHVRPGGVLVYAVCSGEPEEGPEVVRRFLDTQPEFTLDRSWTSAPPSEHEDAFQAARLLRG